MTGGKRMRRYFFHLRDGNQFDEDVEGIELPDLKAVHREATLAAREMIAEYVLLGQHMDGQCFEVTDEDGAVVATIPFKSVINLD